MALYTVKMIKKQIKRFVFSFEGIFYALKHDLAFQSEIIGSVIFFPIYIYLFAPFTQTEILFLALSFSLVIITELQNTAFEYALDKVHPEQHESIKRSKDMAAGGVLIAGFFALFVAIIVALF